MDGHTPAATGPLSLGACIGPMARRVEDLAMLFSVLADPTQFEMSQDDSLLIDRDQLRRLRVAWYTDDGVAPVSDEIRGGVEAAARALAAAGLQVSEATPPGISRGPHLWVELFSQAAAKEIASLYRGKEDEAGPTVARLLRGFKEQSSDSEDKIKTAERLADAVLERERLREELLRWMKTTPLILAPVGATVAFQHRAERLEVEGESVSVFRSFSYAQTFNVFDLPSVAVPAGQSSNGLPIGVQIIGQPFNEQIVLAAASLIETSLGGWQPLA
jgi:Asp-tRNA(Asn)/Glu-tRNA(Gln) amidotransferase A subunit family amidase